jgi:hypothetical protein
MLVGSVPLSKSISRLRHLSGLHHRDQRVVQRHQQTQGVDQRPPESLLADGAKYPRQPWCSGNSFNNASTHYPFRVTHDGNGSGHPGRYAATPDITGLQQARSAAS